MLSESLPVPNRDRIPPATGCCILPLELLSSVVSDLVISAPPEGVAGGGNAAKPYPEVGESSLSSSQFGGHGKILVIAPQPFYTDRGTPIAVRYVLQALHELGFSVDLLTVPVGRDIEVPGTTIHRVPNPLRSRSMPVGFSLLKVFFDFLIGWKAWRLIRSTRYEYVHAVEESVYIALSFCKPRHIPVVYDMASTLPKHLAEHRIFANRVAQAAISKAESWSLKNASAVVCSAGLGAHVRQVAPDTPVFEWIFPANENAGSEEAALVLRRELGIPDKARVVLYAGNFSAYQGVDMLLEAANAVLARFPDVYLVCVGAEGEGEIATARAAVAGACAERVRILPRQPRAKIVDFTWMAQVLVSPRNAQGNFPLKLFDYLSAGKPIVATDVSSHRCVLDESLAVMCPCSASGIAEGISRVLSEPELASRLRENALTFAAQRLSWSGFKQLLAGVYSSARGKSWRLTS